MKMKKLNSSALVPRRYTCLRCSVERVYRQSEDGFGPYKHDNRAYPFIVSRSKRIERSVVYRKIKGIYLCLYYDSLYRFLTFLYMMAWQR